MTHISELRGSKPDGQHENRIAGSNRGRIQELVLVVRILRVITNS